MQECPKCGKDPIVTDTRYGKRASCCGLVGWGGKPLQDKHTRARRQEFHAVFDPIWKTGQMKRNTAYRKLAELMGLPEKEVHGAQMTYVRLGLAIEAAKSLSHQ